MKLLMNFVKDDLKEARESEDIEKKNSKIDRVLEQRFHKMLQEIQEVFAEQMSRTFIEYMRDSHLAQNFQKIKRMRTEWNGCRSRNCPRT